MPKTRVAVILPLLLHAATALRLPLTPRRVEPLRWAANAIYARQRAQMGLKECQLGVDVEVRSAGERKGRGIFTLRTIREGELIGRYCAPVSSLDEASDSAYSFRLKGGYVLDAQDPERSNWLRFIIHSRRLDNVEPVPAYALGINYAVVFLASEQIEAGTELLFDYGEAYWNRVIPNRLDPRRVMIDYF